MSRLLRRAVTLTVAHKTTEDAERECRLPTSQLLRPLKVIEVLHVACSTTQKLDEKTVTWSIAAATCHCPHHCFARLLSLDDKHQHGFIHHCDSVVENLAASPAAIKVGKDRFDFPTPQLPNSTQNTRFGRQKSTPPPIAHACVT